MSLPKQFFPLAFIIFLSACLNTKPYYNPVEENWKEDQAPPGLKLEYSVFLIGDVGKPSMDPLEPTLLCLEKQLEKSNKKSCVIFLGDNIYPDGLPDTACEDRDICEKYLNAQLDILKNYPGQPYFIPGNHDWDSWGKEGLKAVKRQETYIEDYLNNPNSFIPDNGCLGPVEIPLGPKLTMIAYDSQWWVHKFEKGSKDFQGCDIDTKEEFLERMEELMVKNRKKEILLIAHHPFYTNGNHGGFFNWKDHLFPLTKLADWLWLPLPVVGSIYPLYRKYIGHPQDLSGKPYKEMKNAIEPIISKHPELVFAAGHEHNLQYHFQHHVHHIVSGAGCKATWVRKKKTATYTQFTKGFSKLLYYGNGEVWMEFWVPTEEEGVAELSYRKLISKEH